MSEVRSYRDLQVWQRAMDVAVGTYELTKAYPREELFGLTSQSRRPPLRLQPTLPKDTGGPVS